jgi:hypothetical protein
MRSSSFIPLLLVLGAAALCGQEPLTIAEKSN